MREAADEGFSVHAIAARIGIHPQTLRRHFADELHMTPERRRLMHVVALYRRAIGGSVAAIKEFLRR